MVAAAVVGSTVAGGLISADAASSAADTQAQAAQNASATQAQAQRDATAAQLQAQQNAINFQKEQTAPYTQAGQQALSQYQNLLNGGAANFDISKMPGYQFQQDQAKLATQNSAAAGIGALSGNAQIALQDRAQGIAGTQFNSYLDRLAGLASLGQNAAVGVGNTGAGIISNTGSNIASGIYGTANNIASNTIGAGNVTAASQVASGNAIGSALNSKAVQDSLGSLFGGSTNTLGTAAGASFDPYQSSLSGGFIPQGL